MVGDKVAQGWVGDARISEQRHEIAGQSRTASVPRGIRRVEAASRSSTSGDIAALGTITMTCSSLSSVISLSPL